MKKLIVASAIAMSGLIYQNANAQIGVHLNINLGARPVVVQPAPVYDADYYYLPDVEAYYSVVNHCYYYQDGGAWVSAAYLPGAYRNYDWRTANHYAVREARPYLHNDVYRARYGGIQGRRDWNYRSERVTRVYADRDRFDDRRVSDHSWDNHQQYNNGHGNDHYQPQNYDHRNDNNRRGGDNDRQGRGRRS